MQIRQKDLQKIKTDVWEIPKTFRSDMEVPARLYASEELMQEIWQDRSLEQLINTTTLPGVVKYSLAMPDVHEGYGCPIGGVVATRLPEGIISPGAIGYDINCGVRLLVSTIQYEEIKDQIPNLIEALFRQVPSGVGSSGQIKLTPEGMKNVLEKGIPFIISRGYGQEDDIQACEENGQLSSADASMVSDRAKKRGQDQLGTLGSGNHFLEIEKLEKIFDQETAKKWGLWENQIAVTIHTGSRGLGHQNCTDYVGVMHSAAQKYKIKLPDPELACAPFNSKEGQHYFAAMSAAANYAWANRQCLTHYTRKVWQKVLSGKVKDISLKLIYDVAHNIAKVEEHQVEDKKIKVCVHRKGATRSFPDQPVIIPGSMGTATYLMIGQDLAMRETFGTVCHGGGRVMSRAAAKKKVMGRELQQKLAGQGITVRSHSMAGLAEEAPLAYKDIDDVVEVVHNLGLAKKVARFVPLGVIKG